MALYIGDDDETERVRREHMITEEEYLKALEVVKAYQKQVNEQVSVIEQYPVSGHTLRSLPLTGRSFNSIAVLLDKSGVFKGYNIRSVLAEDAAKYISCSALMDLRHCGHKSVTEIQQVFKEIGIEIAR